MSNGCLNRAGQSSNGSNIIGGAAIAMLITRKFGLAFLAASLLSLALCSPATAQDPDQPAEEVVANLAAGRVIIAVYKDAIVIASIENKIEPATLTPPVVPITEQRAGILLGATVWVSPSSRQLLANLASELPTARRNISGSSTPHLIAPIESEKTASDIEQTGLGFLVPLNEAAGNLHGHVDISNEPLTELLLVGYLPSYGAEIWQLTYGIHQEPERGDYWQTRVQRPRYTQIWPPEKKAARNIVEVHYPADDNQAPLRDLLLAHDERLEKIRATSPELAAGADAILQGNTDKMLVAQGLPFLKAAVAALAENSREQMAIISQANNFQWLIAPPPEERVPPSKNRPEGAPTLMRNPEAPTLQKP